VAIEMSSPPVVVKLLWQAKQLSLVTNNVL
jgi:hypothetical protein